MNNKYLVSIIIPAYNSEDYISEAIKSTLNQTWKNIEIIVVDDGSTDNTYHIAKTFENKGVIILKQQNKGACAARNLGISKSNGNYIQLLDSDDILLKDKIEKQINALKNLNDDKIITFCNTLNFHGTNKDNLVPSPEYPDKLRVIELIRKYYIFTPTVLIPKRAFNKFGFFNEKLLRAQEHEFHVRLAAAGYTFVNLHFYGALVRHHNTTHRISNVNIKNTFDNDIYLLKTISGHIDNLSSLDNDEKEILYSEIINLGIFKAQQHGNIENFKGVKYINKFLNSLIKEKKIRPLYDYKSNYVYNKLLKVFGLQIFELFRYLFLTIPKKKILFKH